MIKVAIETLGCKLNQAESETAARQLIDTGCQIVKFEESADIYIINTCTVTSIADRKSRHLIRQAHRTNPQAKIIAMGCYVTEPGLRLRDIEGLDLIVNNDAKKDLSLVLLQKGWISRVQNTAEKHLSNRTRSFIKVQDGCNQYCSYCIVPLVRGRENSVSPQEVIQAIRQRVAEGYQEVVLTGTEIGRYHHDRTGLAGLLRQILEETLVRRLRLSSLQPDEITPELVSLWQNPRLCRHFHLSLQSGSEAVLRRMNRAYSCEQFAEKMTYLRVLIPDVSITTDVIVGFPGENDDEFQESYDFCRRMKFARTHVFSYSARSGTAAAGMPKQIPPLVKKLRSIQMIELGQTSLEKYNGRFSGTDQEVLFEQLSGESWSGYTDTYIRVYIKNTQNLANRLMKVRLLGLMGEGLEGQLL